MYTKKVTKIYSEKYCVKGIVEDYGIVTKLIFTYQNRQITMGINRNLQKSDYKELGRDLIESYIENLNVQEDQIRLYNWYVRSYEEESELYHIGKGIVTGHPSIPDTNRISTSNVKAIYTDLEKGEVFLATMNHVYHCPLEYCKWYKQDKFSNLIPEYDLAKKKFQARKQPSIEPGYVLLVLSDYDEYYFNSLYYKETEDAAPCNYYGDAHVGMFQDSYLIMAEEVGIDLRYFPHYKNIDFYREYTEGRPFYLGNIGNSVLFAKTSKGLIKLAPGERKKVCKENAEIEKPVLPRGDLYPADIIE